MTSLRALKGRPAIAHDSAERLGTVGGIVVDPAAHRIVALQLDGSGMISWHDVAALGDDAVMVSVSSGRPPDTELERRAVEGSALGLGVRLLQDDGDELGPVDDVEFDADTGDIVTVRVADHDIAGNRLEGIGRYAVVVATQS